MINVADDIDDDVIDEIIPHVPKFWDVISNDWVLSHICISWESDLEVKQTFSSKNELVNIVKQWYIAHSVEYRAQRSNFAFV